MKLTFTKNNMPIIVQNRQVNQMSDPETQVPVKTGISEPMNKKEEDENGKDKKNDYVFDQFGRFVRKDINVSRDQMIIEHSASKYQRVYQFNDPKTDVAAINYNIKKFGKEEFKKMQFVFFMSENWLEYAASDSNVGNQSWLENTLKPLRSVGEEMDPAAYNLPQFFDEQNVNLLNYWNDNEIFKGDKGPLFIIEGDGYKTYNYMDTGNFIWGYFMNILGYSSSEAILGAKRFNPADSKADITAVRNGNTYRDTKNKIFPKPIINLFEYQKKKADGK